MKYFENLTKPALILFLKFTFVALVLYFLANSGFLSLSSIQHAFSDWKSIALAVGAVIFNELLAGLRWGWLLQAYGIKIRIWRLIQLTFIGEFFSIAIPGMIGETAVKTFYIGRQANGQYEGAIGIAIFDRIAGASSLILLSALAVFFGEDQLSSSTVLLLKPILTVFFMFVILFYTYLFVIREVHDPILWVIKRFELRLWKFDTLMSIYKVIRHYHNHPWTVIKVLSSSLLTKIILGWICLKFSGALGESQLSLLPILAIVPFGLLISDIPVAPAGIGTGHAAFLYLFQLIGSAQGANIFTLYVFANMFMGIIGGLIYLRFKVETQTDT